MRITVRVVAGSFPSRHHPGRCADRSSPGAMPLFEAARRVRDASPELFPIRDPVGATFRSREPLPTFYEHDAATAIIEVLVDAGILSDERLVTSELSEVDPEGPDGYQVALVRDEAGRAR